MKTTLKVVTLSFLLATTSLFAKDGGSDKGSNVDKSTEIKEYIQHHLQDSYDFSLFSYTKDNGEHVYVGFPLPVILWDNGLKVFSSSKFHHGETVAEVDGSYYKVHHAKIYKTDAAGTITYDEEHHATNEKPLDFSLTKNVFMVMMVFLIMFFMFKRMASGYKANGGMPKGMGRLLEPIIVYVRDDIARPNIGEKHYRRYMG